MRKTEREVRRFGLGSLGVVGVVLTVLTVSPADACEWRHCQDNMFKSGPSKVEIRNSWSEGRIRVGDIYDPGHGRPLQIRNNSRQILGTIERDGSVRNPYNQIFLELSDE
jgi:hypothetical protein